MPVELDVADWRRRIFALYDEARRIEPPVHAWERWCAGRAALFRSHSQSPFHRDALWPDHTLHYFAYDPALRFEVVLTPLWPVLTHRMDLGGEGALSLRAFARTVGLASTLGDELTAFWIAAYGGGVFLPFRGFDRGP